MSGNFIYLGYFIFQQMIATLLIGTETIFVSQNLSKHYHSFFSMSLPLSGDNDQGVENSVCTFKTPVNEYT